MNPAIFLDGDWIPKAFEHFWGKGENPVVEQGGARCLPTHLTRHPVFVRDEYLSLWNYIEKVRTPPPSLFGNGGIVAVGQPGSGEYPAYTP